jgi:hypothetical protein
LDDVGECSCKIIGVGVCVDVGARVEVNVSVGMSVGPSVDVDMSTGESVGCCTCVFVKVGLGVLPHSGAEGWQENKRREIVPITNIQ